MRGGLEEEIYRNIFSSQSVRFVEYGAVSILSWHMSWLVGDFYIKDIGESSFSTDNGRNQARAKRPPTLIPVVVQSLGWEVGNVEGKGIIA